MIGHLEQRDAGRDLPEARREQPPPDRQEDGRGIERHDERRIQRTDAPFADQIGVAGPGEHRATKHEMPAPRTGMPAKAIPRQQNQSHCHEAQREHAPPAPGLVKADPPRGGNDEGQQPGHDRRPMRRRGEVESTIGTEREAEPRRRRQCQRAAEWDARRPAQQQKRQGGEEGARIAQPRDVPDGEGLRGGKPGEELKPGPDHQHADGAEQALSS